MSGIITGIDWTPIITGIIAVLGGMAARVVQKYVVPWLVDRRLAGAAVTIVNAVEILMRDSIGEDKCKAAMEKLAAMGFKADYYTLREAVEAAYNQMHIAQVAAGLKDKPPDETK